MMLLMFDKSVISLQFAQCFKAVYHLQKYAWALLFRLFNKF